MSDNIFSGLIKGGTKVSRFRKARHSASNFVRGKRASSRGLSKQQRAVNTAELASTAFGVTKMAASAMKFAGGAVAGGGFVAAMTGPQAAVAGSVLAIAKIAKSMYSNRETAHIQLTDHVWNLIDDEKPATTLTGESLEESVKAAMTLMNDGKNQIAIMGVKFVKAEGKMKELNKRIIVLQDDIASLDTIVYGAPNDIVMSKRLEKRIAERDAIWDKETKPGGVIHQYVRRCSHLGNYMQAPHIIALSMMEKSSPGYLIDNDVDVQKDYFKGNSFAEKTRKIFKSMSQMYVDLEIYP